MSSRLILVTGMPSSGKTTLSRELQVVLRNEGVFTVHMDGMEFRRIFSNKNFSRKSNGELFSYILNFTEVFLEKDLLLIYSIVAHKKWQREKLKAAIPTFHVHLECPLEILKKRDEKGVYQMADRGEMFLPGYSEPYEEPIGADLFLNSCVASIKEEIWEVLKLLRDWRWI